MMTSATDTTLSRFPAAAADFVRDLYVEHLEEASFFYDQRNYLLEHIEFEANDIAWNEQRCDRHLDALVAGGDLTLMMCKERAASGEAGELYAAMRVFCRANRPDVVKDALDELDVTDAELIAAARDGLKHDLPRSWNMQVSQWLDEADEPRGAILAVACAHRDLGVGPALVLNASGSLNNPVPFLWALGRLREPTAMLLFRRHLQDGDLETKQAAAIGALRCGDQQVRGLLRQASARGEAWAPVPLSLVGELGDFEALRRLGNTSSADTDVALAMGLLGHWGATRTLLEWLRVDDVGEGAAMGLHLLTGLYPLEGNTPESGAAVGDHASTDGNHLDAGLVEARLARSRGAWEPGCRGLHGVFTEGTRVQLGQSDPVTPVLRVLVSPRVPIVVRNLLTDAILVRRDVYVPPCDGWHPS